MDSRSGARTASGRSRSSVTLGVTREGTGPPLVLLHGLGAHRGVWKPVIPFLTGEHEVLAFDLPGFGDSPPLEGQPTAARLAVAIAGELSRLGIGPGAVVGNSLGGWVAMEMALAGQAENATAIAPAGLWRSPLVPKPVIGQRIARLFYPLLGVLVRSSRIRRALLAPQTAHPEKIPRGDVLELLQLYARAKGLKAANDAMRAANFTRLDEIGVPVTLIWPEHDRLIARPRKLPPQIHQAILPGCGHLPMWDDPAAVAAAVLAGARSRQPA
jgi:pimeloyl-ACP methyl ester carboxylesterase